MKNISSIENCYGCGVCGAVCGKRIIKLRLNADGFYEPFITDQNICSHCGLCVECCAYVHQERSGNQNEVKSYAAWSKQKEIRQKCSSGGIAYELGRQLLEQGYKACGVRYNVQMQRAEHFIATTPQEYIQSIGSKYIQSYTLEAFQAINRKERYFVTGTPCQIDSFRRYIEKFSVEDHFVLLDFFCHGVPSIHVWTKYLKEIEKETGKTQYVSWRNKTTEGFDVQNGGEDQKRIKWTESYRICIQGERKGYIAEEVQKDHFYTLFLSNICLGRACYEKCKYKYLSSAADIRIGDLWGKTYQENEEGVNALLTFTAKGQEIVAGLKNCVIDSQTLAVVTEGQLKKNLSTPLLRRKAMVLLKQEGTDLKKVIYLANKWNRIKAIKYYVLHPFLMWCRIKRKMKQ